MTQTRQDIRYGSQQFKSLTQVFYTLHQPGWYKALCHPSGFPGILSAILTLWRLPRAELTISARESKDWFADNYVPAGRKLAGSRWGQAVLAIQRQEYYLVGRRKQALRSNLHHALKAGVKMATVDYPAFDIAARQILTARRGAPEHTLAPPGPHQRCLYCVATSHDGMPLVFAGVANFGNFGFLFIMYSRTDHPDASFARYLAHTHLLAEQAKKGTNYLLCGPVFNQSPGQQYFQHLLGYRPHQLHYHITGA